MNVYSQVTTPVKLARIKLPIDVPLVRPDPVKGSPDDGREILVRGMGSPSFDDGRRIAELECLADEFERATAEHSRGRT
jgi:hypothetical protein